MRGLRSNVHMRAVCTVAGIVTRVLSEGGGGVGAGRAT
jgi:hypothetical protein